jgi:paraquat-inducible protein B
MAARASPKLIGAFVVGAVALLVIIVIGFASTSFLAARLPVVMYFPGDVGGLDVGAPVTFKGVRVGTVTGVELRYNVGEKSFQIPVRAELERERFVIVGEPAPSSPGERIPALIEAGLRARLASESLVTGKLQVNLDLLPHTEVRLVGAKEGEFEIPTLPTTMEELQASIAGFLEALGKADLAGLVVDVRRLVNDLDSEVQAADLPEVLNSLEALIQSAEDDIGTVAASLTKTSDALGPHMDVLSAEGVRALRGASKTFATVDAFVTDAHPLIGDLIGAVKSADALLKAAKVKIEPGSALDREVMAAVKEIATAARSLRVLADTLERDPNSILFGRPGSGQQ